jgi:hypothetical protein
LRGITIDRSEESENASDSIRINRDSTSNETDSREKHDQNEPEQRISRLRGRMIDGREESENAFDSIRVNRDPTSNETD